ncbi:MAG: hypothetical protein R3232_02815 [Clostridia bacterium]|nr:hypothetical protein [Clostridia bacterium]
MDKKIDRKKKFNEYKRKRNLILFLLFFPAMVIIGSAIAFYFLEIIKLTHLTAIYLPLIIADLIVVFFLTPKLHLYNMYVSYSELTLNEPHFLKAGMQLFTTSWIDQLKSDGYELVQEDMTHLLLCKFYKKLPHIPNSDKTLVFITIAKNNNFDFYGDTIDNGMQVVYMKNKKYQRINKQITLQFKKYDIIDEEANTEIESAILYHGGNQILINLSFGYQKEKTAVYCLNPNDRYPNKYVYFAFTEFKRLCGIRN